MYSKKVKGVALVIGLVLSVLLLPGCQNVNNILGGPGTGATITVVSNEITFPIVKIRTLNPLVTKDEDAYFINKLVYQGLFELNQDLRAMPVLARNAEPVGDGSSLLIELQENVFWSDGEPFIPEDVKYSIEAYKKAMQGDQGLYSSYFKSIISCKVEKDNKVLIGFKDKESAVLESLTFPVVSSRQSGKKGEGTKQGGDGFLPIGTGPYMVTSLNADKEIVLGANPHYEGKQPDNILIFKVFPDRVTPISLFEIGSVDFMILKEPDRDIMIQDKPVKEVSFASNEVEMMGFNLGNLHLSKKKVRQAIAYAIDVNTILDEVYYGKGVRCETMYPPGYLGVPKEEEHYPFNLKKAKSMMEEAGYEDVNGDGIYEDADGNPLKIRLLVNEGDQLRNRAAQLIKGNLEKAGIALEMEILSWEAYRLDIQRGRYDIYLGGYKVRDPYSIGGLYNVKDGESGLEDGGIGIMVDRLNYARGTEEKVAAFDEVNKFLLDELPQYCFFYKTYGAICAETLEGEVLPTYLNIYNGCQTFTVNRIVLGE